MQCAKDNQEVFHGLQCELKGRGEEVDKCFGNVELISRENYGITNTL